MAWLALWQCLHFGLNIKARQLNFWNAGSQIKKMRHNNLEGRCWFLGRSALSRAWILHWWVTKNLPSSPQHLQGYYGMPWWRYSKLLSQWSTQATKPPSVGQWVYCTTPNNFTLFCCYCFFQSNFKVGYKCRMDWKLFWVSFNTEHIKSSIYKWANLRGLIWAWA